MSDSNPVTSSPGCCDVIFTELQPTVPYLTVCPEDELKMKLHTLTCVTIYGFILRGIKSIPLNSDSTRAQHCSHTLYRGNREPIPNKTESHFVHQRNASIESVLLEHIDQGVGGVAGGTREGTTCL